MNTNTQQLTPDNYPAEFNIRLTQEGMRLLDQALHKSKAPFDETITLLSQINMQVDQQVKEHQARKALEQKADG